MTAQVVVFVQALDGGAAMAMATLVAALVARSKGGFGPDQRAYLVAAVVLLSIGFGFSTAVTAVGGFSGAVDREFAFQLLAGSLLVPLAVGVAIVLASTGARRLISQPGIQSGVVAIHALRVIEGSVFVAMVPLGVLPAIFALPAGLGDVLTGLFALPASRWISAGRWGRVVWWNVFGLLDLANATVLGVTTNPGPINLLHTNPTSALLVSSPLTIIPTFVVPIFVLLHLVSLRFLAASRTAARSSRPMELEAIS